MTPAFVRKSSIHLCESQEQNNYSKPPSKVTQLIADVQKMTPAVDFDMGQTSLAVDQNCLKENSFSNPFRTGYAVAYEELTSSFCLL